jgi:hypothetical protein
MPGQIVKYKGMTRDKFDNAWTNYKIQENIDPATQLDFGAHNLPQQLETYSSLHFSQHFRRQNLKKTFHINAICYTPPHAKSRVHE